MKNCYALIIYLLINSTGIFAQTTETEPNNELANANNLTLETEVSGEICIWNNEDWFQVVLPEDGLLEITVSSTGEGENPAAPFYFQLWSDSPNPWPAFSPAAGNNGVMTTNEGSWCCLKAGTFYIQVYSGYAFEYCYDYTLSLNLVPASYQNDNEPNSSFTDNLTVVNYNTPTDGHLSFIQDPQNGGTDNYDNFKIIPPTNGLMRLFVENEAQSTGSGNLSIMMHNGDGSTWYQQVTSAGNFQSPHIDTLYWDCATNDTFIVQFFTNNFYDRGYAYRFRYDIISALFENDVEPNNAQSSAQIISISEPATGNLYYYGDASDDIFKFLKPDTGFFKLRVTSTTNSGDGTLGTKVQLMDHNFNLLTQLNAPLGVNGALGIDSMYFASLPADTFYIRVFSDYAFAACRSYLLEFYANGLQDNVSEADEYHIAIYPNPASDNFVLDTRNFFSQSTLQITDMLGEIVVNQTVNGSALHQIDIANLSPGIYLIDVSANNRHRAQRLIVQD